MITLIVNSFRINSNSVMIKGFDEKKSMAITKSGTLVFISFSPLVISVVYNSPIKCIKNKDNNSQKYLFLYNRKSLPLYFFSINQFAPKIACETLMNTGPNNNPDERQIKPNKNILRCKVSENMSANLV